MFLFQLDVGAKNGLIALPRSFLDVFAITTSVRVQLAVRVR